MVVIVESKYHKLRSKPILQEENEGKCRYTRRLLPSLPSHGTWNNCTSPARPRQARFRTQEVALFRLLFYFRRSGQHGVCVDIEARLQWLRVLKPTSETTAEVTVDILVDSFTMFTVAAEWVADRGSHFNNKLVSFLRDKIKTQHHFTLAFCPWSNGTIEVVNCELLRASRALISEYQLPQTGLLLLMPVVQAVLNSAVFDRLGGPCSLTAFLRPMQQGY